jgi:hypothetical protein
MASLHDRITNTLTMLTGVGDTTPNATMLETRWASVWRVSFLTCIVRCDTSLMTTALSSRGAWRTSPWLIKPIESGVLYSIVTLP